MIVARLRRYLARHADLGRWPLIAGDTSGVDQVIVIPAVAEEQRLFATLESIARCPAPDRARTLVICVVNNRPLPLVDADVVADNQRTLARLRDRIAAGGHARGAEPLRLACVDAASPGQELPARDGVGLARKIGLDHGVQVLAEARAAAPLLLWLDADTIVSRGYLTGVRSHYADPGAWAAVVRYVHPLHGPPEERAAILCYELWLRYCTLGLRWAGSPYALPTVGSTISCRAEAYAAVSGMNRRCAGEDFYFLQKLVKTGEVRAIRGTTVQPCARPSWRVPFGTGARIARYLTGDRDEYRVYHPAGYAVLRDWLAVVDEHPEASGEELLRRARGIDGALGDYLARCGFAATWQRLQDNAPDAGQLLRQFQRWFDGLRTLRLLHHLREHGYPEQEMFGGIAELGEYAGVELPDDLRPALRDDLDAQRRLLERLRAVV